VRTSSLLILGGARSGKSRYALASAREPGIFLATAEGGDPDMVARIERHRRERAAAWRTVEEPRQVVRVLRALAGSPPRTVLIDCVTLWIGNLQLGGESDESILGEVDALAAVIVGRSFDLILVSNEVGLGVHPETPAGLRYRDLLGLANQRLATACDRVVLMAAGLPLTLKEPRGVSHAAIAQAP
jgi:adenosylcobinamide kinase/adenosylcobinamide-phosphate guanylyltransferase